MAFRSSPLVMLLVGAAALGGCGPDREPSGPVIDSLQSPATLSGLPRTTKTGNLTETIVDHPPGLASVVSGYGTTDPPPFTLEAYYGNPAGIEVVRRAWYRRLGDIPSGERCASPVASAAPTGDHANTVTCWRSDQTLFVAVTVRSGRTAADGTAAVDEAWRAITA